MEETAVQTDSGNGYAMCPLSKGFLPYLFIAPSFCIPSATLDEVEDPPDVVDCHSETPHALRLMSKYLKENPQVWQTSTTPEGTVREDEQGFLAKWMTRPA